MPDPTPTPWRFQRRHYDNGAKSQGCALGHPYFEPVFLVGLSHAGSTGKMNLNFHSLASALGIFLARAPKKGATQAVERARSSPVFSG
jgi:hypothetical protein